MISAAASASTCAGTSGSGVGSTVNGHSPVELKRSTSIAFAARTFVVVTGAKIRSSIPAARIFAFWLSSYWQVCARSAYRSLSSMPLLRRWSTAIRHVSITNAASRHIGKVVGITASGWRCSSFEPTPEGAAFPSLPSLPADIAAPKMSSSVFMVQILANGYRASNRGQKEGAKASIYWTSRPFSLYTRVYTQPKSMPIELMSMVFRRPKLSLGTE